MLISASPFVDTTLMVSSETKAPFARFREDALLANHDPLDRFLAGMERRAFRMAEIATSNPQDAMDIVQDSMIKLVERYRDKPADEWQPLFYRILQSKITDWHRRSAVRKRVMSWFGQTDWQDTSWEDQVPDPTDAGPDAMLAQQITARHLMHGIKALPLRQQQAFLLRNWEGLSVRETAAAMGCTQGSVKTHFYRATHTLAALLKGTELDEDTEPGEDDE